MFKKELVFNSIVILFAFGTIIPVHSQPLKTVKLMTPTLEGSIVFYESARRLGFYQQEGLRLELVQATLTTAVQAILGGSADYLRHGSAIGAILEGVPFKVLAVDTDKSPQYIVAKPGITSLKDLVGKTIAIDDIAGAANWVTRETLIKNGIPLDKITFRRIGAPPMRFQALITGLVDAAPLNFIWFGRTKEKNFHSLVYSGDFVTDVQLTAAAPIEKLQKSPEEIYKFVKATLKGRYFQYENPEESYKFFLELEALNDSKFARDAWDELRMRSSKEARVGLLSKETTIASINDWKAQMKLAGRAPRIEGRAEDMYDFSFAKRADEELKAEGWDPRKYRYIGK